MKALFCGAMTAWKKQNEAQRKDAERARESAPAIQVITVCSVLSGRSANFFSLLHCF